MANRFPAARRRGPVPRPQLRVERLEDRATPAALFTEFPLPAGSQPTAITTGPDGHMWFTETGTNKVGRLTLEGTLTEFAVGSQPTGIVAGPDGNLWFTETGANKIGVLTTTGGTFTEYAVPTAASQPTGIVVGPDGNLWFTQRAGNKIGMITTAGAITEYPIPTANSEPFGITVGADGNLWFTERAGNQYARITPAGVITEFAGTTGGQPTAIAPAVSPTAPSSGTPPAVFFTDNGAGVLGQFRPTQQPESLTTFNQGLFGGGGVAGLVTGPAGDQFLWVTSPDTNEIIRLNPDSATAFGRFTIPTAGSEVAGIAVGPDQNIWFTEATAGKIGRLNRAMYAVAASANGGPHVKVFDADTTLRREFFAYVEGFFGGVRVATGDVNNDGIEDLVTVPGVFGGPHVKVWDGVTGELVHEFMAYDPTFHHGVFVAASLHAGIVTGPGPNGGPHVKRFSGTTGALLNEFMAYDPSFLGGAAVAVGDLDGNGRADEIVTGPVAAGGPHVRVFNVFQGFFELRSFMAYPTEFSGGVFVATGDVDGDGRDDIVTGAGGGSGPNVRAFSGATGGLIVNFMAYDLSHFGGVHVATAAVGGDGRLEIITGPGQGLEARVDARDKQLNVYFDTVAFDPAFTGGVWLG